jgi:hypothetical protein
MRLVLITILSTAFALPRWLGAQAHDTTAHHSASEDSAFRAMQTRGQGVMGVDQYTSVHRFDATADGGRIELQRDRDDSLGVAAIRAHMRTIARDFAAGNFSAPATVHLATVPGVRVMQARRRAIRYEVEDLPHGAALRIRSRDERAVGAVHDFLAYQRREHRTGGAERAH